jgi:hypothetical protein
MKLMQINHHKVSLGLRPVYYLLVLFALFFFSQTNFDTHTRHAYVALHASPATLNISEIDLQLPKETVDLHHRSEHKRNHIVQRKRGIVAYFIKKSITSWQEHTQYNYSLITHNYNSCALVFIRPLYYVYLFRYALF